MNVQRPQCLHRNDEAAHGLPTGPSNGRPSTKASPHPAARLQRVPNTFLATTGAPFATARSTNSRVLSQKSSG